MTISQYLKAGCLAAVLLGSAQAATPAATPATQDAATTLSARDQRRVAKGKKPKGDSAAEEKIKTSAAAKAKAEMQAEFDPEDQSIDAEAIEKAKARAERGRQRRIANPNKGLKPAMNMKLLNAWGDQTSQTQLLYAAAWKVLAAKTDGAYADLAGDAEVESVSKKYGVVLLGGPMLGNVSSHGASVWVRTLHPAAVEVQVTVDGAEKNFGPVNSTAATDMTAVVAVDGLKPETSNAYRVLVDGKAVAISENAAIVTTSDEAKQGKVRIAFGADYHRLGLGNQKMFDVIRDRHAAALLNYGDLAVQDRDNKLGLHRLDYMLRDFYPAWRSFSAAVPVYATWDDHDYFDNDSAGIPEGFTKADQLGVWNVFRHAWANPAYGFDDERHGVFFRTRIGPCDVLMTDDRYFRTGKVGSFLGDEQMKWLEAQLLDCKGPFIILTCGTMWSDYVSNSKDSWGLWDPKGRDQLFDLIEKHHIGGVLLVSGDRHGARGFTIPRPSGFKFHEFNVGSMGGRTGPPATNPEWTEQFFGANGMYAFGEFSIDTTLADPEVTFRLIDDSAKVLTEKTFKRSELTPQGK